MPHLCVYCGKNKGTTKDHVIPKSFFPQPRPANLMTVKCCPACQKKYKKDEDLSRMWLNLGPAGISEVGKALWKQKLKKTIQEDTGIRNILSRSIRPDDIKTPAGIYLGRKFVVTMERRRAHNLIQKILRGLFWIEYGERLPQDVLIEIAGVPGSGQQIEQIIQITHPPKRFWENIFEYRHVRLEIKTFESMWIMSFYRHYYFLVFVDVKEESESS